MTNLSDLFPAVMGSPPAFFAIACSDETSALEVATAVATFRAPHAMTAVEVSASVNDAPTGAALQVDINVNGTSMLSTKLTIDAGEETSATAATAAVISAPGIAKDDEITIDIDVIGSTVAGSGLKVVIEGT